MMRLSEWRSREAAPDAHTPHAAIVARESDGRPFLPLAEIRKAAPERTGWPAPQRERANLSLRCCCRDHDGKVLAGSRHAPRPRLPTVLQHDSARDLLRSIGDSAA